MGTTPDSTPALNGFASWRYFLTLLRGAAAWRCCMALLHGGGKTDGFSTPPASIVQPHHFLCPFVGRLGRYVEGSDRGGAIILHAFPWRGEQVRMALPTSLPPTLASWAVRRERAETEAQRLWKGDAWWWYMMAMVVAVVAVVARVMIRDHRSLLPSLTTARP